MNEPESWRAGVVTTLKGAFVKASAASDRLALLRSWARAAGGSITLSDLGQTLTADELVQAQRFGLAITDQIRVIVSELDDLAPGLETASRLDSHLRRAFRPACPDGILRRFSAYSSYQGETQKAAVRALMTAPPGAALAVSMPTGSGKSLLFQLATRAWRARQAGACAIVITPLVGLAQDHERTVGDLEGLEASRALHGDMSPGELEAILFAFRRGEIPLLLMSPEIAFGRCRKALLEAAKPEAEKFGLEARLSAVFIDEAHIIESWGRTFRPDFQRLPSLIDALRDANPDLVTVLLSATLSPGARDVLRRGYGADPWLEVHAGTPRYDLDIVSQPFESEAARDAALMRAIDLCPRPAIVYTTRVEPAEQLHALLQASGYRRLALFTGDTDTAAREDVIARWADNELDLVVATSAFGLGINKGNVRTVIHACLPEGAARWYQEIGRAARDGHQGLALALWTDGFGDADAADALGMAASDWLTRPIAEGRWEALRARSETTWDGATRVLSAPLDAAPKRLGKHTGAPNRRWNQSLLNLLQRAGALEVIAVHDDLGAPTWRFHLNWDGLLDSGAAYTEAWDRVFLVRDAEQKAAMGDARRFVQLMRRPDERCLLIGAYGLIEPEIWDAPPCGRCPTCRAAKRPAPHDMRSGGLDAVWPTAAAPLWGATGALLIRPDAPETDAGFATLLNRLAAAGIEQFVVPDGREDRAADVLRESRAEFGFILSHSDWLEGRWALANLPTAAILSERCQDDVTWLRRAQRFVTEAKGQRLLLVADPTRRVGGRRLDQVASPLAAYEEAFLESLAARAEAGAAA